MIGEIFVDIADAHTDSLGHLNHVVAVRLLEDARDGWYGDCGLYRDEPGRYGTVVVNINYDYRREVFLAERVRIVTTPESMGTKSFVLHHEIIKPDGDVAIEGRATSVVMDMTARAVISVPECLARHLPAR